MKSFRHEGALSELMAAGAKVAARSRAPEVEVRLNWWLIAVSAMIALGLAVKVYLALA